MQTFVPYANHMQTAKCLDDKRLWNQVNEAQVIYNTLTGVYAAEGRKGWPHHPATKMWEGCETGLLRYVLALKNEIYHRTGKYHPWKTTFHTWTDPYWLGDDRVHASHRSNLLRKAPEHYHQFGWSEPDDMEYFWPKPPSEVQQDRNVVDRLLNFRRNLCYNIDPQQFRT